MCGRARLSADYSEIKKQLRLSDRAPALNWRASWNIAPTQDMFAVVHDRGTSERVPAILRWGLVPAWSKAPDVKYATFNARVETIESAPSFRGAWKAGRRCLVVVEGYYEWRKEDRQPFAIGWADGRLMAMAGLWETWRSPEGASLSSCTVITTPANTSMASIHDRMPAILPECDWPVWLGETPADLVAARALLRPYPLNDLAIWPVDRRVGNIRNNDAALAAQPAAGSIPALFP